MKKMNMMMSVLALVATPALAQQKTYDLQVTESDLVTLSKYLGKAPYEEAAPIIQRLGSQVQQQMQQRQAAPLASPSGSVVPHPRQDSRASVIGSKAAAQASQPVVAREGPKTPSPADMEAELREKGKARPPVPADHAKPASAPAVPAAK